MKNKEFDIIETGILMTIAYSWGGGLLYAIPLLVVGFVIYFVGRRL